MNKIAVKLMYIFENHPKEIYKIYKMFLVSGGNNNATHFIYNKENELVKCCERTPLLLLLTKMMSRSNYGVNKYGTEKLNLLHPHLVKIISLMTNYDLDLKSNCCLSSNCYLNNDPYCHGLSYSEELFSYLLQYIHEIRQKYSNTQLSNQPWYKYYNQIENYVLKIYIEKLYKKKNYKSHNLHYKELKHNYLYRQLKNFLNDKEYDIKNENVVNIINRFIKKYDLNYYSGKDRETKERYLENQKSFFPVLTSKSKLYKKFMSNLAKDNTKQYIQCKEIKKLLYKFIINNFYGSPETELTNEQIKKIISLLSKNEDILHPAQQIFKSVKYDNFFYKPIKNIINKIKQEYIEIKNVIIESNHQYRIIFEIQKQPQSLSNYITKKTLKEYELNNTEIISYLFYFALTYEMENEFKNITNIIGFQKLGEYTQKLNNYVYKEIEEKLLKKKITSKNVTYFVFNQNGHREKMNRCNICSHRTCECFSGLDKKIKYLIKTYKQSKEELTAHFLYLYSLESCKNTQKIRNLLENYSINEIYYRNEYEEPLFYQILTQQNYKLLKIYIKNNLPITDTFEPFNYNILHELAQDKNVESLKIIAKIYNKCVNNKYKNYTLKIWQNLLKQKTQYPNNTDTPKMPFEFVDSNNEKTKLLMPAEFVINQQTQLYDNSYHTSYEPNDGLPMLHV